MDPKDLKIFYEKEGVVLHYGTAVNRVGLWKSEEIMLPRLFSPEQNLLELGCGAGRIAFGMYELGFNQITAIDISEGMVDVARAIADEKDISGLEFQVGDATKLEFADESFDGAIFGFNGLMQIPGWNNRMDAMDEIFRVIKPGSFFFFTTHDRENPKNRKHWKKDAKLWRKGLQNPEYEDQGDTIGETPWGDMFIHVPNKAEIEGMAEEIGFQFMSCKSRSDIALESNVTREFSDECLMWVFKKPSL